MWKYAKRISALACLIIWMIPSGHAQSARQSSVQVSPEASLMAPVVSPISTEAWSDRALEKVEEWIAYLNLLRQSEEDSLMQKQLIQFSEAYFLDSESQLIFEDEWLSVGDWLTLQATYSGEEIKTSDFVWKDDWMLVNEDWRRTLAVTVGANGEEVLPWEGERFITVVLSRVEKSFGEEMITTWEIRFDELR